MKRKNLFLLFLLIILIFQVSAQQKADPKILWSAILDDNFNYVKNLETNDFNTNIAKALIFLLEDNPIESWNYWKKAIQINSFSYWHDIIGLLGEDIWENFGIFKEIPIILKDKKDLTPYMENLYWKSLLSQQNIKEINNYTRNKGFITDFLFIGPFENIGNSGLYKEFPPEKEIMLNQKYKGKNGLEVNWFKPIEKSINGYINLYNLFYPNEWTTAYALCYIFMPKSQEVLIKIGSPNSYKLFIDDSLIYSIEAERQNLFNQEIIKIYLPLGWHKFLIKVSNTMGPFGFYLRITNQEDEPISGIKVSDNIHNYIKRKLSWEKIITQKDFIRESLSSEIFYAFYGFLLGTYHGYSEDGEEFLERAEKIKPKSSLIKFLKGKLEYEIGNLETAKKYMDIAYKGNKDIKISTYYLSLYNLNYGRYEDAIKMLKENTHNNSFLLRSLLSRIFIALSWEKEVNSNVNILSSKYPDSPETLLLIGKYYEIKEIKDKAIDYYQKALSMDTENWEIFLTLYNLADELNRIDILENLLDIALEKDPTSTWAYLEKIRLYMIKEDKEKVSSILERVEKISSQYPEIYLYKGKLYLGDNEEKAIELFERTLQLNPYFTNLRTYINYLKREEYNLPDISSYLELKIPEEYLEYPAVILLDKKEKTFFNDGTSRVIYHKLIKILKNSAKDKYGEIQIDYDSNFERVRILRARTIKPNGDEIEASTIQDFPVLSEYPLYTDERKIIISYPGVEKGAILECLYMVEEYTSGIYGRNFQDIFFFQNEVPTLFSRFILKIPKNLEIKYSFYNGNKEPDIEEDEKWKTYKWEMEKLPAIIEEPLMPKAIDLIPQVWITTFKDWEQLADLYYSLAYPQIRADKAIKEKVKELISGMKKEEDKIKAIYYYVTSEIRYVGLEFGIGGIMPHSAPSIFREKYGDCKDKAILLITMLQEAGIEAYYTLVNTKYSISFKKDLPAFQFDHAIVAVPLNNNFLFLDGTAENTPFGEVPYMDQGADVMIIKDKKPIFTKIPISKPEDNAKDYKTEIVFENGKAIMKTTLSLKGFFATYFRLLLADLSYEEKENLISHIINNAYPGSHLTSWNIENLYTLEAPLKINIQYYNSRLLKDKKYSYIYSPFITKIERAEEISKEERIYPIEYYLPYEEKEIITINLSSIDNISDYILENVNIESPWITYTRKCYLEGKNIIIERNFKLKEIFIPTENYKEYKKIIEEIIDRDNEILILK